jgi:anthranilate/para-aminobenzoate synthase component II
MNVNVALYACLGREPITTIQDADTNQIAIITQEQHKNLTQTGTITGDLIWSDTPPNCPLQRFNGQILEVNYAGSSKTKKAANADSSETGILDAAQNPDLGVVKESHPETVIGEDQKEIQRDDIAHNPKSVAKRVSKP